MKTKTNTTNTETLKVTHRSQLPHSEPVKFHPATKSEMRYSNDFYLGKIEALYAVIKILADKEQPL